MAILDTNVQITDTKSASSKGLGLPWGSAANPQREPRLARLVGGRHTAPGSLGLSSPGFPGRPLHQDLWVQLLHTQLNKSRAGRRPRCAPLLGTLPALWLAVAALKLTFEAPFVEQYRPDLRKHTYSFFHDFLPSSFTCKNPWISGQLLEFKKFCWRANFKSQVILMWNYENRYTMSITDIGTFYELPKYSFCVKLIVFKCFSFQKS